MSDKKIEISSQERLWGHQESKNNIMVNSLDCNGNSNLISFTENSLKIIGLELLTPAEIERLGTIENSALVQSLRTDKILLKKSYLNEFSYASEANHFGKK